MYDVMYIYIYYDYDNILTKGCRKLIIVATRHVGRMSFGSTAVPRV